jgi:penicillin-binding protein 2
MDSNERLRRRDVLARIGSAFFASVAGKAAGLGGVSLLVSVPKRRVVSVQGEELARRWVIAPGSTIKPLSLIALLDSSKLTNRDEFECPGELVLGGHRLNCSHPRVSVPMNVSRAIAYSCNCAVAHFAQRFAPGEFAAFLTRFGLSSVRFESGVQEQLQALGEEGVYVTPLELAMAYRRVALHAGDPKFIPVVEGMEGAVEFGTAQKAGLRHIKVAGKTGTVRTSSGARAGWFAGFAPSRSPEVAVVVLVQGRSGGSDAAPVAGRVLQEYFGERA